MIRVGLQDGLSRGPTLSACGDNGEMKPSFFEWDRTGEQPVCFYTDMCMPNVLKRRHRLNIAWLREAPPYAQCHYDYAMAHEGEYDYILTYHRELLETRDPRKWLFCPYGGTAIPLRMWRLWPKSKNLSLFASFKDQTGGHKLRHEIKRKWGSQMDVLGTINGFSSVKKFDAIAPYRFSVIVHAECLDWGFSDHLLDAFALGAVPIHWGCPDIGRFFNLHGMLCFNDTRSFEKIVQNVLKDPIAMYDAMLPAVHDNWKRAREFAVIEDWLWKAYPFLFEGVK